MTTELLLAPRSPLIFRLGKPFGATGGGDAFGFPPPATIAGALRAHLADELNLPLHPPKDHEADHRALRERLRVKGPLLVHGYGSDAEVYFPRPADAVYLRTKHPAEPRLVRAMPRAIRNDGEGCDLPDALLPVCLDADDNDKRADVPGFWSALAMGAWLSNGGGPSKNLMASLPPLDLRTHVGIDRKTLANDNGRLFQSAGLDFGPRRIDSSDKYFEQRGWGLLTQLADTQGADLAQLDGGVRRLGADGRSARLKVLTGVWPLIPRELVAALETLTLGGYLRLVLATPAIFTAGWRPGWLKPVQESGKTVYRGSPPGANAVELELVAAAVERWTPYSGWDLEQWKPRAIRRLAPAGSVYWFKLTGGSGGELSRLWLSSISDNAQDQRDGFGLALPGIATIMGASS